MATGRHQTDAVHERLIANEDLLFKCKTCKKTKRTRSKIEKHFYKKCDSTDMNPLCPHCRGPIFAYVYKGAVVLHHDCGRWKLARQKRLGSSWFSMFRSSTSSSLSDNSSSLMSWPSRNSSLEPRPIDEPVSDVEANGASNVLANFEPNTVVCHTSLANTEQPMNEDYYIPDKTVLVSPIEPNNSLPLNHKSQESTLLPSMQNNQDHISDSSSVQSPCLSAPLIPNAQSIKDVCETRDLVQPHNGTIHL